MNDQPISLEEQAEKMKKYIVFTRKTRIINMLKYTGYFRLSRYGKYILSQSNVIKSKPNQELLFQAYEFDMNLRKLMFDYVKRAEIQFKAHLSNAVSIKTEEADFYLSEEYYTPSKSEKDKVKRDSNRKFFGKFLRTIISQERDLRKFVNKYPELKEYRNGGRRSRRKVPSWAAFSYFEFGTITNMYAFLRGDLRKAVLVYGYLENNYGKEVTKQMDTWLDAIRNLRNVCAHHNKLIGKTSSIVLTAAGEENCLVSQTDLFSRMYALKKVLNEKDGLKLGVEFEKLLNKSKFDVYQFGIVPRDWKIRYDGINKL